MTAQLVNLQNKFIDIKAYIKKQKLNLDQFKHIEHLIKWGNDLKSSLMPHEQSDWDLLGRAVFLIHQDPLEAKNIFCLLADIAQFNFINLKKYEVIDYLTENIEAKTIGPCILFLEPGEWMKKNDNQTATDIFHDRLSELILNFDVNHPIVFATSGETINDLAPNFRKKGLFDRRFEIAELTLQEKGEEFIKEVGINLCDASINLFYGKVGKFVDAEFNNKRKQGLAVIFLKRLVYKQKRKLNFADLIYIATRGTGEILDNEIRTDEQNWAVAVHEAGHALITMIDSDGADIPEFSSILPNKHYEGVVVSSYEYRYQKYGKLSYKDYRQRIRVNLAGRAAEEILLGHENISVRGSSSDLENASSMCGEMFGFSGISPELEDENKSGSNLLVVLNEPTASENSRVEKISQIYLEKQYAIVKDILNKNLNVLNAIAKQLQDKFVLSQEEIYQVYLNEKNPKIKSIK
jgi:hypothetical protein